MGSKGSQTTTNTNQAQTYTADQMTRNSGMQAINMAQSAAAQPFQMPVAPVAGFSADQQGAFDAYRNMQGSFNPYAQQAANAFGQSATPITAGDVSQYYNPMVDNITRQMQNIYGQQNAQNTGNLVQSAGGVGADRIAVGQANLSREQDLAAGQTYAGLYQQALQQAQQQKQMEAGAGSGFLNTGTALNSANLADTNAYLQSGQLQQQQAQAQLNAPYQNTLARIAYPFQTAQYLAGITGSLAPTFGGTTTGSQYGVTTPPTPSLLSQVAGIGTAGVGLYGALNNNNNNNIYSPNNLSDPGNSLNNISDSQATQYENLYGNRGGATPFSDGGDVTPSRGDPEEPRQIGVQTQAPPDVHPLIGGAMARRGMAHLPESHHDMMATTADTIYNRKGLHRADGGGTDDPVSFPGMPAADDKYLTPISLSPMHPSGAGGHSGPLTGGMNFPSPQQQNQGKSDSVLGDIAGIAGSVAKIAPLFALARGGVAGYDGGGGIFPGGAQGSNPDYVYNPPDLTTRDQPFIPGHDSNGPSLWSRLHDWWTSGAPPAPAVTTPAKADTPGKPITMPDWTQYTPASPNGFPGVSAPKPAAPVHARPGGGGGGGGGGNTASNVAEAMMPTGQQPYPDALDRDWGQTAARSPWMALVSAGAKMASTPGPLGVSIGKGLEAGMGTIDSQRKDLTTEQGLNQKAQALYQTAKAELDKYTKMTPSERAHIALKTRELDQNEETGTTGLTPKDIATAQRIAEARTNTDIRNTLIPMDQGQRDALRAKHLAAILAERRGAGAAPPAAAATAAPAGNPLTDSARQAVASGRWTKAQAAQQLNSMGITVPRDLLE